MKPRKSGENTISLSQITENNVPPELSISAYFDFTANTSELQDLFDGGGVGTVLDPLIRLRSCLEKKLAKKVSDLHAMEEVAVPGNTIVTGKVKVFAEGEVEFFPALLSGPREGMGYVFLGRGTVVIGSSLCTEGGYIAIGEESTLGPGSVITGPSWVGGNNEIRPGCFFRENVATGKGCVFRCEAKHSIFLEGAQFPHPSYVGDSILGFYSHFGNQASTANITLSNASRKEEDWKPITIKAGHLKVDTGLPKLGIIMGDHSQAGCGAVFDPGVFLGRSTWVYPLSLVRAGFYGPSVIIKNSPARTGVIDIVPFEKRSE